MSKLLPIRPICLTSRSTLSARLVNIKVNFFLVIVAVIHSFVAVLVILMIISVPVRLTLNILLIISSLAQLLVSGSRVVMIQHLRLFGDGAAIDTTIVLVSSIVLAGAILG